MRAARNSATAATVSIVTTVDVPVRHAPVPDAATRNSSMTPLMSQRVWEREGTGDAGSSLEFALPDILEDFDILGDFDAEWEVESQDD
jgi:hypothetical protein